MKQQEVATSIPAEMPFDEHLQTALQAFRAAIIELLDAVGAEPSRPQEIARRFGLNKNLTWKISKIVTATEPYTAVPHIPGAAGVEIFLRALADADAPRHLVDQARAAAREIDRVIKIHTGDRSTLEIMVSNKLPAPAQVEQAELSRRRAYQANSGIWGVRARTQISLNIMAPNRDEPDMADLAQVGGLDRFRRLRPDARWLLFRRERWDDADANGGSACVLEALDDRFPPTEGIPLLGSFCSKPIPDIELITSNGEDQYELPPGPVGNTAAFTCMHGEVSRRIGPAWAETDDEWSEIGCNLITPVEHLLCDVLVHRDFTWAMSPDVVVYSRMDGGGMRAAMRRERNVLPVAEPVHDLGWGKAAMATPLLPRYTKLVDDVFERLAWNPGDFRAFRFTMTYPPIPTAVLLRSKLPSKRR